MATSFLSYAAAPALLILLHISACAYARSLSPDVQRNHQLVGVRVKDAARDTEQESSVATLRLSLSWPKPMGSLWTLTFKDRGLEANTNNSIKNTGVGHGVGPTSWKWLVPLRKISSRKQVLGGSGATFFEQDANGGSINNLGVTNSQRSRVGDGMGYASSYQDNSMAQTSATNPVLPTFYGGSSVTTTAATNGAGSSFPFAGLGATGDVFVGVDGQLIPTGASVGD